MRRILFIVVSLIVLLCVAVLIMFGFKSPEMPVQEVHKVIPISKQNSSTVLALPDVPVINIPAKTFNNIQQPPGNQMVPAKVTNSPSANGSADNTTSIPIIIPRSNDSASQPVHVPADTLSIPSPGAAPGNAARSQSR